MQEEEEEEGRTKNMEEDHTGNDQSPSEDSDEAAVAVDSRQVKVSSAPM